MLQKLRKYTDFTTQYSNPDIGSLCTAYGVYNALRAGEKFKLNKDSLKGLKISIKGIGKVGYQLANYILKDGAEVILADKNIDKIENVKKIINENGADTSIVNLNHEKYKKIIHGYYTNNVRWICFEKWLKI